MELSQLKYFVSIAETLSFTRAAEFVHVSQPALSYQMRRLEDELGCPLFHRKGRGIALTPDGELFLPLAQAVLARAAEAVRVLREHGGDEVGEVRMGGNTSVAAYLVPTLLASFHQVFPKVRVEVIEGGDLELQQQVYSGSIEFAVVTAPGTPQTLDVTRLGTEDMFIIAPLGHRMAGRKSIDLAELAFEDFVLPTSAFNLATQLVDACRRAGFEPRVAYRAGSVEAVKNLVRMGLGVSIVPSIALGEPAREGLAVLAVEGGLTRELNLIQGKDRAMTRAAKVLMEHVRNSVIEHLRSTQTSGPAARAKSKSRPT